MKYKKVTNKLIGALNNGATVQIGVEGANFMHLLRKKIEHCPEFSKVCLWDFKTEGGESEKTWLTSMGQQVDRGISAIAIICDIDIDGPNGRNQRVERTSQSFKNVFQIDVAEGNVSSGVPALGFLVVPSLQLNGCLETALLENPNSRYMECARNFVDCVDNVQPIKNQNYRDKTLVRSLIVAKDPDLDYSSTSNSDLWDWQSGSLKNMLDFIEKINATAR